MRESRWSRAVTLIVTLYFGWAQPPPASGGDIAINGSFEIRAAGEPNRYIDTLTPDREDRLRQLGARVSVKDGIVREVDLTDSGITDADMEIFSSLGSLEHLTLNGCPQLTDAGLVYLKGLSKLKGLSLERTNVTDAGLPNLSGLTGLTYLSLNWTRVGDTGLKHLSGLTNLGVFYLCDTNTADAGLTSLKGMSKLQWLDLRGTRVTDAGLAHLSNLSQLRLLSLHGIRMTDAGVSPLTELSNLEVLTLSQTRVTAAGLLPLKKLPTSTVSLWSST